MYAWYRGQYPLVYSLACEQSPRRSVLRVATLTAPPSIRPVEAVKPICDSPSVTNGLVMDNCRFISHLHMYIYTGGITHRHYTMSILFSYPVNQPKKNLNFITVCWCQLNPLAVISHAQFQQLQQGGGGAIGEDDADDHLSL